MKAAESSRRADLLNASINYMLAHGVADLSLRPLAAAVGSKARLLVYHFGSKEALITEAMIVVRERVQQAFTELMRDGQRHSPPGVIRAFWKWATSPEHERYLRLFFEVQGLALQNSARYGKYLKGATSSWVEMLAAILPEQITISDRQALATLAVGSTFGLLLEYLSDGERRQVHQAFETFLDSFEELLSPKLLLERRQS